MKPDADRPTADDEIPGSPRIGASRADAPRSRSGGDVDYDEEYEDEYDEDEPKGVTPGLLITCGSILLVILVAVIGFVWYRSSDDSAREQDPAKQADKYGKPVACSSFPKSTSDKLGEPLYENPPNQQGDATVTSCTWSLDVGSLAVQSFVQHTGGGKTGAQKANAQVHEGRGEVVDDKVGDHIALFEKREAGGCKLRIRDVNAVAILLLTPEGESALTPDKCRATLIPYAKKFAEHNFG